MKDEASLAKILQEIFDKIKVLSEKLKSCKFSSLK